VTHKARTQSISCLCLTKQLLHKHCALSRGPVCLNSEERALKTHVCVCTRTSCAVTYAVVVLPSDAKRPSAAIDSHTTTNTVLIQTPTTAILQPLDKL
jgi:hypothetical protein